MVREKRPLSQISARIYTQDLERIKRIADKNDTDVSRELRRIIRKHFTPKKSARSAEA